jgi:hypothetical protein
VLGVLADLSTYVHSIPPGLWFGGLDELYADSNRNRAMVAVWLRVTNYYLGRCFALILQTFPAAKSTELTRYIGRHEKVFAR